MGLPSGMVVVADYQTLGRGRLARRWVAPPQTGVAFSVMLRPESSEIQRWSWLPLLAGLAVAEGLQNAAGAQAELKWPNDVLIGGKKICGILAERVECKPRAAIVLGMGINTSMTADQLPVPTATSLTVAGLRFELHQVVAEVLDALACWFSRWEAGDDLVAPYTAACATIGNKVKVITSETQSFTGVALGVDLAGCLMVRGAEEMRTFAAGDVVHLR